MKILLILAIFLLGDLYVLKAQDCLDSVRIKCYVITPVRGSNYEKIRVEKQKRVTDIVFSDHYFYKYFLPLDSIKGEKDLKYWLRNYKLLEKNKFSTSDHWLIEKRTLDSCHQVIKLHPSANSKAEGIPKKYEVAELNNEVAFMVRYIDGIWNKIEVNLAREGEFLNAEQLLCLTASDTIINLFILRNILSEKEIPDPAIPL